jgi:hypothetical protein
VTLRFCAGVRSAVRLRAGTVRKCRAHICIGNGFAMPLINTTLCLLPHKAVHDALAPTWVLIQKPRRSCLPHPCSAAGFAAQQGAPDPRSPTSAVGPTLQHAFSAIPPALLQPGTPPASPPMSPPRRATGPPANSVPHTEGRPPRHIRSLAAAQAAQQPDDGEASHAVLGSETSQRSAC